MVDFNKKLLELRERKATGLPMFKSMDELREREARISRHEYATIIAGSRGLNGMGDVSLIDHAVRQSTWSITRVLSGTAKGIDQAGEKWAAAQSPPIPVDQYPADWDKEGKSAGYRRNEWMAVNGDALIAVWDGESRGTKHMIERMRMLEKPVYVLQVYRYWVSGLLPRPKQTAFTVLVVTDEKDKILWTADMVKVFIGQDLSNLVEWGQCELELI